MSTRPNVGVGSRVAGRKEKPRSTRLCENWGESDREGRIDNDAAFSMSYIRGEDREQASFLPARIDDYVGTEAAVRVIDAFAEGLNVVGLGFVRAVPAAAGSGLQDDCGLPAGERAGNRGDVPGIRVVLPRAGIVRYPTGRA